MRPVAALLILALLSAPSAAQTRLTDADLPHVVRLLEAAAEGRRRERIPETEPDRAAPLIDAAVRDRRAVFDQIDRGALDPLAWLRSAAPRLAVPPEARYLPQCSRALTRIAARALLPSAAEGASFPVISPVVVFTMGEGSVSEYAAAAAREDTATVNRLEREAVARTTIPRADAPIMELLTTSMSSAMGLMRTVLVPTGPGSAGLAALSERWQRDSTLQVEGGGASLTATPRDLSRDSVEMTLLFLPMTRSEAEQVGCADLTPAAWIRMELITRGPFDGHAVESGAEAAVRAIRGAQDPSFLWSALWDACKAAAPYGAKWVAGESESREDRALLTANGVWFARHRARLESLLLAARADAEEDACGMDPQDIAALPG